MQHGQVAVQAQLGVEQRPSNHGHGLVAFYQGVERREPHKVAQQAEEEEVGEDSFCHQLHFPETMRHAAQPFSGMLML